MKTVRTILFLLSIITAASTAAVSLQINGTAYESIALKTGQAVTAEIVSTDASAYSVYTGFATAGSALGTFVHLATLPAAGNLASVTAVAPPPVWGFYASAGGAAPAPSAGVHFQFTYTPNTVGSTTLYLYASDASTLLDSIAISVEPATLGSAFTYQGRLIDDNQAPDAAYDFEFKLYDAPTEGSQLGSTNTDDDVDVIDGYFISDLDFGLSPYNGNSVWLQIGVRPGASTDPYTIMSPRQRLTSTPNANFATRSDWNNLLNMPAGFADGVDNDTHLTESQVESYIANDVVSGYMPYSNGSKLLGTDINYAPASESLGFGMSADSNIKMRVYNDSMMDSLNVSNNRTSGSRWGIYVSNTGSTTGDSYGIQSSSSSSTGSNYGVYGRADILSTGTNYGVYGFASNGGAGVAYAGYFSGDTRITGKLNHNYDLQIANDDGAEVAIGTSIDSSSKLKVYTTTDNYAIYGQAAGTTSNNYAVRGYSSGNTTYSSYGVYGSSSSPSGANYGVYGYANTPSSGTNYGVYGYAGNSGTGSAYAGYFSGNVYVTANVSAASFTDRTPYPKDLQTAVDAVMSMSPLPAGQYQADNKEQQLDHSTLSPFIRSEEGKRDLSATVSCHNEVLKDLLSKQQELTEAREMVRQLRQQVKSLEQEVRRMDQLERENSQIREKLLSIETALSKSAQ
jgi:hypothetical protein